MQAADLCKKIGKLHFSVWAGAVMKASPLRGVDHYLLARYKPHIRLVDKTGKGYRYGRHVHLSVRSEGPSLASRSPKLTTEIVRAKSNEIGRKSSDPKLINASLLAAKGVREILSIVADQMPNMNTVNLATAFHRIAKSASRGGLTRKQIQTHPVVLRLARKIRSMIGAFEPRSLAGMCWAHAALFHGGHGFTEVLFDRFGQIIVSAPDSVGGREICSLVCACGKLGRGKDTLDRIAPVIGSRLPSLGHRAVVHVVWACAKVEYKNKDLLLNCVKAIRGNTEKLTIQGKANLVWGCARLDVFDHSLFLEIAQSCQLPMHDATPADVSNFAWGFAKLVSFSADGATYPVDPLAEDVMGNSEQVYCTVLCDLGLYGAFKTLCSRAVDILNDHNVWSRQSKILFISSMMWCLATVRWKDYRVAKNLLRHAYTLVDYMQPRAIATILWSMAKLRIKDAWLMDALADRGQQVIVMDEKNLGQYISMCLYSYAYLNHTCSASSQSFIRVLQDSAVDILPSCKPQVVANVAWAAVALGSFHTELLRQVNAQVLLRTVQKNKMSFKDTELALMHQVQLSLRVEAANLAVPMQNAYPSSELLKILYEVGRAQGDAESKWIEQVMRTPKISDLHLEVLKVLQDAGFECTLEHIDGYPIDIALLNRKIAVEVDGPFHFTRNTTEPLGMSILKRRVLEGRGWIVVNVPHFVWASLQNTKKRSVYLQKKIGQPDCQQSPSIPKALIEQKRSTSGQGVPRRDAEMKQTHDQESDQDQDGRGDVIADRRDILSYKHGTLSAHSLLVRKAQRNIKRRN